MYWRLAQVFALVVLLFWAGAFALFVFPGQAERTVIETHWQVPSSVENCERLEKLIGEAQTEYAAKTFLGRYVNICSSR